MDGKITPGPLVYTDTYKHTYNSKFKAVDLECVDYYIHSESHTCRSTDLKMSKGIIIAYREVFVYFMYINIYTVIGQKWERFAIVSPHNT